MSLPPISDRDRRIVAADMRNLARRTYPFSPNLNAWADLLDPPQQDLLDQMCAPAYPNLRSPDHRERKRMARVLTVVADYLEANFEPSSEQFELRVIAKKATP